MSHPSDDLTPELERSLAALPREREPRAGLEDEIVNTLVAHGHVTQRAVHHARRVSAWWRHGALAATMALIVALAALASPGPLPAGPEYLLLLNEDSLYVAPPLGHDADRVTEYRAWADSLSRAGRLVKAAELEGAGPITGFFIVRAGTDDDARHLAATSPHVRYRGTVDVRRLVRH